METTDLIRVNVEGFRAIKSADIKLNGITVVAGENSCGKSTLSKMLYYLFKTAANYEILVAKNLSYELGDLDRIFSLLLREFLKNDNDLYADYRKNIKQLLINIGSEEPTEKDLTRLMNFVDKITNEYSKSDIHRIRRDRNYFIVNDILGEKYSETNEDKEIQFDKIKKKINDCYKKAFGLIESRPSSLLKEEFKNVFHDNSLPAKFEVFEKGATIISIKQNHLGIPYYIQNVIYVDTPMSIRIVSENGYWNDLNDMLEENTKINSEKDLSSHIRETIIEGDVSVEDNFVSKDFSYKRKDGKIFDLLDVATGIKSFGILQLLIKNGKINDKTLLIVDEPESNLHPQWVVEYARLLVLINKNIEAKIFIASHNPDMISAIKYISEKEGVDNVLNFYLAEKAEEDEFTYSYQPQDKEIGMIFKSFNIALERITQYGS